MKRLIGGFVIYVFLIAFGQAESLAQSHPLPAEFLDSKPVMTGILKGFNFEHTGWVEIEVEGEQRSFEFGFEEYENFPDFIKDMLWADYHGFDTAVRFQVEEYSRTIEGSRGPWEQAIQRIVVMEVMEDVDFYMPNPYYSNPSDVRGMQIQIKKGQKLRGNSVRFDDC